MECDPLTSIRVMETFAAAEGSVEWCASISSAISYLEPIRLTPQPGMQREHKQNAETRYRFSVSYPNGSKSGGADSSNYGCVPPPNAGVGFS